VVRKLSLLLVLSAMFLQVQTETASATLLMTEDLPVFNLDARGPDETQRAYSTAKYMGASFVRSHFGRDANFTWAPVDRFVDNTLARGMQPYLTLTYRREYQDEPDPAYLGVPTPQAFGQWCAEAADRYDGRVQHFSVWNEPNYFGDGMTAPLYNALYRACAAELRAEIPNAKVGRPDPISAIAATTSPT
jgi:hypothetical protein